MSRKLRGGDKCRYVSLRNSEANHENVVWSGDIAPCILNLALGEGQLQASASLLLETGTWYPLTFWRRNYFFNFSAPCI